MEIEAKTRVIGRLQRTFRIESTVSDEFDVINNVVVFSQKLGRHSEESLASHVSLEEKF